MSKSDGFTLSGDGSILIKYTGSDKTVDLLLLVDLWGAIANMIKINVLEYKDI